MALDLVFVASGILHDGEALEGVALERVYQVNAIGPALVAKHFLPLLARDRKSVFAALSARGAAFRTISWAAGMPTGLQRRP